jgi:hypothetical protein
MFRAAGVKTTRPGYIYLVSNKVVKQIKEEAYHVVWAVLATGPFAR